ncbi:phosphatase PAP2 family protein [Rickettsiales endosymbiont of Peranema trichophorum]|uniref:phosphatase PAP2 family protein n=1 Tax=Rickettsiales endosymbiont of Peranema trichophorum TaxID=2486577 RepID=UPI0010230124|nr:phosphatase PAP2 family protein [Rickettsiales endosymbiont of Peranema trichophorum]RZI46306.1 phosphatase PAP2 family protein [Rickettsiales endosymbiont of Peranema trichophorum]
MLTIICQTILSFSNEIAIIPIMILGYIALSHKVFFHGICLLLLSMLLNLSLKNIFQVPLLEHLGKAGFAFPSGHMQSCVVFYGWLMLNSRSVVVKLLTILLLVGVGFSLVYMGYHTYFDILGAIFFGSILVLVYMALDDITKRMVFLLVLSTLILLHINGIGMMTAYVWKVYLAIIFTVVGQQLFDKESTTNGVVGKIVGIFTCFGIVLTIHILLNTSKITSCLPEFMKQLEWAMIGFSIPLSARIGSYTKFQIK